MINIPQLLFLKVLLLWFHDVSASQGVMYLDLITGMLKFKFKGIGYTVLRRRLENSKAMCCGEHVCVIYVPRRLIGVSPLGSQSGIQLFNRRTAVLNPHGLITRAPRTVLIT